MIKSWIAFLVVLIFFQSCTAQLPIEKRKKINGVSFVSSRNPVDSTHVKPLVNIHANYAAVMPFGSMSQMDTPQIFYNRNRQWYGETREGGRNYVKQLHDKGIDVMLKPQIWIRGGGFTGYIKMGSEEDWATFENTYHDFIMLYARLAQEEKVTMFCIGTELEQFVIARPDFWKQLIIDVRKVFKGKLTYAANWDEYSRTPFWNSLDYIGIDAYFPVCEDQTPTIVCAEQGWQNWKEEMSAFAKANQKQILFTEYGYRSVDFSGKEPWKADRSMTQVNLQGQANSLQALFNEVWDEDWMAGGFLWKWFIQHDRVGGLEDSRFTPQNKPAELVVKEHYKNYN